jgi:hypothetical protein
MKRAMLLLLVGSIMLTTTSCGWLFVHNFESVPKEDQGDMIVWVLILDIIVFFPSVFVEWLWTGTLYENKAMTGHDLTPDRRSEQAMVLPTGAYSGRLCMPF